MADSKVVMGMNGGWVGGWVGGLQRGGVRKDQDYYE